MKTPEKLAGMVLLLIIAGSLSLSAQRGSRGMERANRMWSEKRQMPMMLEDSDSLEMRAKRFGTAPGKMICQYQNPHAGRQYIGHSMRRQEWGMWHALPGVHNISDLTDSQKKEIANLREKQQEEMQTLREEMQKKITDLRESNRKKIMDLLTEEQKERIR